MGFFNFNSPRGMKQKTKDDDKPKPSDLGSGSASDLAEKLKKRKQMQDDLLKSMK